MEKFKRLLKMIFFLPPLPTLIAAVFGYGFVLAVAIFDIQNPILRYASYIASAYALVVTVTGFPHFMHAASAIKRLISESAAVQKLRTTTVGAKYMSDVHFRNRVSLYFGLTVNLAYIVMKLSAGIVYRSAWFVSLAIYYALLAVMRLFLLRYKPGGDDVGELRRYRMCGFLLLIMNQALAGIVIFMVHQNRGFRYPGVLIYAMALYSFYAVITAAVGIVKTRRRQSPVLSATKAVSFVAALVSILSLTTAMLAQFGSGDDADFRRSMTAAVGGGVCTVVIIMASYMIRRANKELKKPKINNSQT